ncbi:site-specific DNA-methyltransferase [Bradyrhizobium manausense]|uniref:site-specific DNA-methyltransferase n=1 Tax=Bradyrhizobium manausense TaxID=989370 RepID=UPI0020136841|nr:DNA methyltransferase [Bradyrhizobium manausense]
MARSPKSPNKSSKQVDALKHAAASRRNIPTAEMESFFRRDEDASPMPPKHYPRTRPLAEGKTRTAEEPRTPELIWNGAKITITKDQMKELAETGTLTLSDAQLVWRGKDRQDWSDLVVNVPPLYIQEKIQPQAIIADLRRRTAETREAQTEAPDMFADFNGLPKDWVEDGFYKHDGHWSNRMILGDSLQVMASLAERESLKGKVQCIYFDPPYGIKFNSNWQVSTQSRDVKDGKQADISREPEQVKAFRDTWKDGIHSYLTYLRDRLTAMRDLLTESGSVFVQISDENVHRVRAVLDEVFGAENFVSEIVLKTTSGAGSPSGGTVTLAGVHDFVLWYARSKSVVKYRQLYFEKSDMQTAYLYRRVISPDGLDRAASPAELTGEHPLAEGEYLFRPDNLTSQSSPESATFKVEYRGLQIGPGKGGWKTNEIGMRRLKEASRLYLTANKSLQFQRQLTDFNVAPINDVWTDVGTGSFTTEKVYAVQTNIKVVQRCILMATDPGDLVLDSNLWFGHNRLCC